MRALLGSLGLAAVLALPAPPGGPAASPGEERPFLTVEEALALSFPGCEIVPETVYLTDAEREAARDLARVDVPQAMLRRYVARREGAPAGTAYLEAHRVRTLKETVLVVVDPQARLARFEVLAFAEPLEYLPRDAWYQQLVGHALDDELELDRGIRGVSGATLTARASTDASRRTLALHAVLAQREKKEGGGS